MDPVHHTPSSESLFCLKSRLRVQLVRAAAKGLWGEGQWLNECKKLFSWSMKKFVTDQRGWDAYVIGIISIAILKHLLPDNVRGNDAACEMHRWFFLYAFTAFACCALWGKGMAPTLTPCVWQGTESTRLRTCGTQWHTPSPSPHWRRWWLVLWRFWRC
jgi:hypothetical protein